MINMDKMTSDERFGIFKEGCAAMDSGDYEEAARQFWILFSKMDRLVKIDRIKKDYEVFKNGGKLDDWIG